LAQALLSYKPKYFIFEVFNSPPKMPAVAKTGETGRAGLAASSRLASP
jgi:hypothetical protein